MKFHILLDEEQLSCYIQGLEFFSRWCAGQTDHLPEHLLHKRYDPNEMRYLLDRVQRKLFPDLRPGSHHGLRVIPGDPVQRAAVVSYEMYREGYVRRYQLLRAKQRAAGEEPVLYSSYDGATLPRTGKTLPTVRVLTDYQQQLLRDIYLDPYGLYGPLTINPSAEAAEALQGLLDAGLVEKYDTGRGLRFLVTNPNVTALCPPPTP